MACFSTVDSCPLRCGVVFIWCAVGDPAGFVACEREVVFFMQQCTYVLARSIQGFLAGPDATHGSGLQVLTSSRIKPGSDQDVFDISRIGSGRVGSGRMRRYSILAGRLGSMSGWGVFTISRVESCRVKRCSNFTGRIGSDQDVSSVTGRVRSDPTRPDPTRPVRDGRIRENPCSNPASLVMPQQRFIISATLVNRRRSFEKQFSCLLVLLLQHSVLPALVNSGRSEIFVAAVRPDLVWPNWCNLAAAVRMDVCLRRLFLPVLGGVGGVADSMGPLRRHIES